MSTVVIIGHGPDNVSIPALIMESEEDAHKLLLDTFGEPRSVGAKLLYDTNSGFNQEIEGIHKFYTSYYGGCGECYCFSVKVVDYGKPFVCFNLD